MRRTWNRLLSGLYTRLPFLPRLYARRLRKDAGPIPWTTPTTTLSQGTVALVTTAGVHLRDQPPFDMYNSSGDASYRIIPGTATPADLTITHDYYDHAAADRDVNVVFPLERLRELASAGRIARVAPRHIGAMGHILGAEEARLVRESAPAITRLLRDDGVDFVVLAPG